MIHSSSKPLGTEPLITQVVKTVAEEARRLEMDEGKILDMSTLYISRQSAMALVGDALTPGPNGAERVGVSIEQDRRPAPPLLADITRQRTWTAVHVALEGSLEEQTFERICDAFVRLHERLKKAEASLVAVGSIRVMHLLEGPEGTPVDVLELLALLPGERGQGDWTLPVLPL